MDCEPDSVPGLWPKLKIFGSVENGLGRSDWYHWGNTTVQRMRTRKFYLHIHSFILNSHYSYYYIYLFFYFSLCYVQEYTFIYTTSEEKYLKRLNKTTSSIYLLPRSGRLQVPVQCENCNSVSLLIFIFFFTVYVYLLSLLTFFFVVL